MAGKRKRGASDSDAVANVPTINGVKKQKHKQELGAWLQDALVILRSHDSDPSILDRRLEQVPIHQSPSEQKNPPEELPSTSISSKIQDQRYRAFGELVIDLRLASVATLEDAQEKAKKEDDASNALQKLKSQMATLKKQLETLVAGEIIQQRRTMIFQDEDGEEGHFTEGKETGVPNRERSKMILTLCGGERNAKQLFSSLANSELGSTSLADQPLPNGITATSVVPVHGLQKEKEKSPTFGQRFAPPSSIKALNPPKQASKHTSTRSSSISWYNPAEASTVDKDSTAPSTYTEQSLATGRWLTYNVAPSSEQLTSPGSKRRHRERALSTGEPQSAIPEEISAAHLQAKEDALFRTVYSSFAPSHDDFGAIVTEHQKNNVWWSKYGEPQYDELLNMRNDALHGIDGSGQDDDYALEQIDDKLVEEAIANWVPSDAVGEPTHTRDHTKAKDAENLLQEVSELLEVLNSHQRIRSLAQPSNSRALQGQKEQIASLPTSPTIPSSAEVDVYETLRSQLMDIITTLPPYLLAKIDGDKLRPLRLSTKIKIPGKNQKGTLEEDAVSVKTKPPVTAPFSSTYNAAANVRSGYTSTPASQQYSRPPYTQPATQKPAPVANTYSTGQYAPRPASASQYTGGIGAPRPAYGGQYTQHRTTSSTFVDRYTNGQYGHQQSPHSYGQYPNNYRPPVAQQSSYGQQYSTPQSRVPPASTPAAQAYRGPQSEYHPRAPVPPGYNYGAAQSNAAMSSNVNQGSPFPNQQRPQLYHQHSSHYGSQSPAPQPNGTSANGQGQMSPVDHAAIMARQKAQIAEIQVRQESGTPQPATGQSTQQNGTPAPQPNGVAA